MSSEICELACTVDAAKPSDPLSETATLPSAGVSRSGDRTPIALSWDGCHNVRDLGPLRLPDGAWLRAGQVVRADALDGLTDVGWSSLICYGIRTVIDLRN